MIRSSDEYDDDDDLGVDLDLLGIVKRRYHLIALGVLVGASLATLFFVQQIPIFQSNLTVLVGQSVSEMASQGETSCIEGSNSIQANILATHVELFRSPRVIREAIEEANLRKNPGEIAESLSVGRGGEGDTEGASLLTASYSDPDPETAAQVLQAVYDSYRKYINDQSRNVGLEAAELIKKSQDENERAVQAADEAYRQFMADLPALVGSGDGGLQEVHRIRLQSIEGDLAAVRKELAAAKSRYSGIEQILASRAEDELTDAEIITLLSAEEIGRMQTIIGMSQSDREVSLAERMASSKAGVSVNLEYQQLLQLTSELRVLKAQFGDGHPSVTAMQERIDGVREAIASARDQNPDGDEAENELIEIKPLEVLRSYVTVLRSDIDELGKRETELLKLSGVEEKAAKAVEIQLMQGQSLKSKLDRARERYDVVFERLQELNLTNDYSGFSTDLLIVPVPASLPIWPSKSKIAAMGLVGGLMLGLGLAMIAEFVDRTFRNPEEVEQVVGAPILAHIPRLDVKKLRRKIIQGSNVYPMIATFHLPRGNESETFRLLRTSVLVKMKQGGKKVFLQTSPSPSDGKSTTIGNLAVSMAQTGKRVLLVDADMRRPTVDQNFGIDRSPGLSDFLTEEEVFADCVHVCE